MATIKEDYVSFETAKLLKKKGFDAKCDKLYAYFADDDIRFLNLKYPKSAQLLIENRYPCITLQMTMKWLRKVHNILLFLLPAQENGKLIYLVEVWTWNEEEGIYESTYAPMPRKEPEEALEAAIKYCLENLI